MTSHAGAEAAWRDRAACIDADPRIFTDPRPDTDDTTRALRCCQRCPVRQPCLDTALEHELQADVGIWGGTTPRERAALRRAGIPLPQLFPTLEGDLTDLTGRALVIELPSPPRHLLLVDGRPRLRAKNLDRIRRHLAATLDEYRADELHPLSLAADGGVVDPASAVVITRLPAPPHLLAVVDGRPLARLRDLSEARDLVGRLTLTQSPLSGGRAACPSGRAPVPMAQNPERSSTHGPTGVRQ